MGVASPGQVRAGVAAFAAVQVALAVMMVLAPHSFYTGVGPFGAYNRHYIRDVATFEAALAFLLLVAVRVPSWRAPALATMAVQYGLHSINHLIDIDTAHTAWLGYADFFSLAGATAILVWLLRGALAARPAEQAAGAGGEHHYTHGGSP
jgi:hypothetical protein